MEWAVSRKEMGCSAAGPASTTLTGERWNLTEIGLDQSREPEAPKNRDRNSVMFVGRVVCLYFHPFSSFFS
jgi:hypothetical protein